MGRASRRKAEPKAPTPVAVAEAPRRSRAPLVLGGVLVVALVGGVIWALRGPSRARPVAAPVAAPAAPAAPTTASEHEPNDTPETASVVSPPVTVSATLGQGDVDIYVIEVPAGSHVLQARVDLAGARVTAGALTATAPGWIEALGVAPGKQLVRVEGAVGDYRLTLGLVPWAPGAEWEPNQGWTGAQQMQRKKALQRHDEKLDKSRPEEKNDSEIATYSARGILARPDDEDCLVVPLEVPKAGEMLRLELTPPASITGRLRILAIGSGATPGTLLTSAEGSGPGVGVIVPALGARAWEQTLVACVSARSGQDLEGSYQLAVRGWTPAGPFEFEPNDDPAQGSALPPGASMQGYLTPGDVDHYVLSAPREAGTLMEIAAIPPSGVSLELIVRGAGGQELARGRSPRPGAPAVVRETDGATLELRGATAVDGTPTRRYSMTFMAVPR